MHAAEAAHSGILQHAQQFGLGANGHLANFVEQQSSSLSVLEAADGAFDGAGKGALFMPKELAFHEGLRQSRAIDRHKRTATPRAQLMDRAGHQFLARSALAADQHGGRGRGDLPDHGEDFLHRRRSSHQVAQDALVAELPVQTLGLFQQVILLNRALQEGAQHGGLDGFLEKPERLQIMHNGDCLADGPKSRQDDGGSAVAARRQFFEQLKAVHARHHQVGQNSVGRRGRQPSQRLSSVRSHGCGKAQ